MKSNEQSIGIIHWTARIMTITFAAFISIFALDVFGEGYNFWQTAFALFIHLIPTILIIIVLFLSWKREWIGGIAFAILGIIYTIMMWGRIDWKGFAMIAVPLFILATLFFIGWFQKKPQHT